MKNNTTKGTPEEIQPQNEAMDTDDASATEAAAQAPEDALAPEAPQAEDAASGTSESQAQATEEREAQNAVPAAAPAEPPEDDLDAQILFLQQQLSELRHQKEIETQKRLETERKKRQIEELKAAIRATRNGEPYPDGSRDFAFSEEDDEKNPFVQASRGQYDEEEEDRDEPFYTGSPAAESGADRAAGTDEGTHEHNSVFRGLAAAAPIFLLAMLALVSWMPIFTGDLVCPKEADNLKLLAGTSGLSLLPHAGGVSMMPVMSWLAWGISLLPLPLAGMDWPLLSFAGAAVCLLGVCVLCGLTGLGRQVMFGTGLILLCLPAFLCMANFIGPVPLACGLSLMAMGFICHGWMGNFNLPGMIIGNLLAALAVLSGGLSYGLVPVVAGLLFAVWRGNMQRLRNTDAVCGVVVFAAALLLWLGAIILLDGSVTTEMMLGTLFVMPDPGVFINRLIWAAAIFFPFFIIVITVSWPRILLHSVSSVRASRSENASAYLWLCLILALASAIFAAQTSDVFLAVCIMAILTARALLNLGRFGTCCFFILLGLILACVTLLLTSIFVPMVRDIVAPFLPCLFSSAYYMEMQPAISTLWHTQMYPILGLCLAPLVCALVIGHVAWRASTAAAPLLVTAVCVVVLAQPFNLLLMPTFSQIPALRMDKALNVLSSGLSAAPAAAAQVKETAPAADENAAQSPAEESASADDAAAPDAQAAAPEESQNAAGNAESGDTAAEEGAPAEEEDDAGAAESPAATDDAAEDDTQPAEDETAEEGTNAE